MKKNILIVSAFLCTFFVAKHVKSQDVVHQQRYWAARDRLQKWFLKIGDGQGESIPMDRRSELTQPCTGATMKWGDATSYLGWYIGVLATEYRILMNDNQTAQAQETLNELYYAIAAVNRLDDDAESYVSGFTITTSQRNGFYIRDDVDKSFWQNWQNSNYTFDNTSEYKTVNSAYAGCDKPVGNIDHANKVSKDQTLAIMMGFALVVKYVDNVIVQPTQNDAPLRLVDEVKTTTRTIMDFWTGWNEWTRDYFTSPCGHFKKYKSTWVLVDPTIELSLDPSAPPVDRRVKFDGQVVTQFDWMVAYPFGKLATLITGTTDYEDDYDAGYDFLPVLSCTPSMIENKKDKLGFNTDLKLTWELTREAIHNDGSFAQIDLPFTITNQFPFITFIPSHITVPADPVVNAQILTNLAALTGTWPREKVHNIARESNLRPFALLYDLFNNHTSDDMDDSYSLGWEIKNLLDGFPDEGSYYYSSSSNGGYWEKAHKWLHPNPNTSTNNGWGETGKFNSIDYMILYNLYRLKYYKNYYSGSNVFQFFVPADRDRYLCPKVDEIPALKQVTNLTQVELLDFRFLDYSSFNLTSYEFLNHNMSVSQSTGILKCNTNLKVCRQYPDQPTILNITTNGSLEVGDNNLNKQGLIRVARDNGLTIGVDGSLKVAENSRVIIEEGATLTIHPGATIELNGSNAVLEIRGKLELMQDAVFATSGNGYVFFNITTPDPSIAPFNVEAGANTSMIFATTDPGNPVKLVVNTGTILYPQNTLTDFRLDNVGVRLLGQGAGIVLGSPFFIQNNYVDGVGSDGFTFTQLSFTPFILNNTFVGCNRTLAFIGRDRGRDIKIRYNTFENSHESIILFETSAHIAANHFSNCGGIFAGNIYRLAPTRGGGYLGNLRIELNRFQNSNALSLSGAYYPQIAYCGNVAHYNGSNNYMDGLAYATDKGNTTMKCNYFEKQREAVFLGIGSSLNMSTQQNGFRVISGNVFPSGGNNIFNNNQYSINISSPNAYDGTIFSYANLRQGQNTFNAVPNNSRSSLVVDRSFNYLGISRMFDTDANGNSVLNGNLWTPLLSTSNYPSGFPSNVIERNTVGSNHFYIREFGANTPNYIVGTNAAPPSGCPLPIWNDAVTNPQTFNATSVPGLGFNALTPGGEKVYMDRPFGLDGQGFSPTPNNVSSGTFSGTNYYTAYNNGLAGMTETTTDEYSNVVYKPRVQGLLAVSDLLINTVNYSLPDEINIFGFGYQHYLQCLSRAVALDVFGGNTTVENSQINAALAVFTAIENKNLQYQYSDPDRFYETKVSLSIDKCHLYRLFERYIDAQAVLSSLSSFIQTKDANTVDYLSCLVENEKKLHANEISWVEFYQNTRNCGLLYGQDEMSTGIDTTGGDTTQANGGTSQAQSLEYILTPNPATSQINVTIDMNVDAAVTIAVFNKFGIQVTTTQNLGILLTGSQTVATVILSGLPADTYNMVVYAGGVPYVQHFIKLTE